MSDLHTHSASRVILAPPRTIFRAFFDKKSVSSWRTPEGMTAKILAFDAGIGDGYRMAFVYPESGHGRGKS